MKRFLKTAISLLLAVSALSCTKEGVKTLALADPSIVDGVLFLRVGDFHYVPLDVFPEENEKYLRWTSSNEDVAIVVDGFLSAIAPGDATITVKSANGRKASFNVTVGKTLVTSWSVEETLYVAPGMKSKVNISVNAPEGASVANLTPSVSDDPSGYIFTSYEDGSWYVGCRDGAPSDGSYQATLKFFNDDGSHSSATSVIVKFIAVTSFSVSPASSSIMVGRSIVIEASVTPSGATYADHVEWTAEDACVSLLPSGRTCKVSGKAVGTATIRASIPDGKSAVCTVNVTEAVADKISARFDHTYVMCIGGAEEEARTITVSASPSDLFSPQIENLTPEIWDLEGNVVKNPKKSGWGMVKVSAGGLSVVRKILVVDKNINTYFCQAGEKDEEGDCYKAVPAGVSRKALPGILMQMYYAYGGKQLEPDDFRSMNKQYGLEFPVSTVSGWTQPDEGKSFYLYAMPPASLGSSASATGKFNGRTMSCSLSTAITSVSVYGNSGAYSPIENSLLLPKGAPTSVRRSDIAGKNLFFVLNPDSMYEANSSWDSSRFPEKFTLCCDKTAGVSIQKNEYVQYLRFDPSVALGDYTVWFKEYPEVTFTLRLN